MELEELKLLAQNCVFNKWHFIIWRDKKNSDSMEIINLLHLEWNIECLIQVVSLGMFEKLLRNDRALVFLLLEGKNIKWFADNNLGGKLTWPENIELYVLDRIWNSSPLVYWICLGSIREAIYVYVYVYIS